MSTIFVYVDLVPPKKLDSCISSYMYCITWWKKHVGVCHCGCSVTLGQSAAVVTLLVCPLCVLQDKVQYDQFDPVGSNSASIPLKGLMDKRQLPALWWTYIDSDVAWYCSFARWLGPFIFQWNCDRHFIHHISHDIRTIFPFQNHINPMRSQVCMAISHQQPGQSDNLQQRLQQHRQRFGERLEAVLLMPVVLRLQLTIGPCPSFHGDFMAFNGIHWEYQGISWDITWYNNSSLIGYSNCPSYY